MPEADRPLVLVAHAGLWRGWIEHALAGAGITCCGFADARHALHFACSCRARLGAALIDRDLPPCGGLRLARQLLVLDEDLGLVATSSRGFDAETLGLLGAHGGFTAPLPIRPHHLGHLVRSAFRKHRTHGTLDPPPAMTAAAPAAQASSPVP
jgi:DNA-binding response OmpR family regulator